MKSLYLGEPVNDHQSIRWFECTCSIGKIKLAILGTPDGDKETQQDLLAVRDRADSRSTSSK